MTLPTVQQMVPFNRSDTLPVKMGVVSLNPFIVFIPLINHHMYLRVESILRNVQSLHKEIVISAKMMAHNVSN